MPKVFFTQSACVLLAAPVSREQLAAALSPWSPEPSAATGEGAERGTAEWAWESQPALTFSAGAGGSVVVDVVARPWPDAMGSPGTGEDAWIFGAWSTQQFGPYAWPGGLERAARYAYREGVHEAAEAHRAFVRIRCVHLGSGEDYDPYRELGLVTEVADALLGLPGALAYFNPNGETLRDRAEVRKLLEHERGHGVPPFPLWVNVRGMNLPSGWALMDSVGCAQLDLPDVEVCFPADAHDPAEMHAFTYRIVEYMIRSGRVFGPGDTVDDLPGRPRWRAWPAGSPLSDPPRSVICLIPEDGSPPPDEVTSRLPEPRAPAAAAPDMARRQELATVAEARTAQLEDLVATLRAEEEADNPLPGGHPQHLTNEVEIGKKNRAFRTNKTQVLREAEVLEGARIAARAMYTIDRLPPPRPADHLYVRCLRCRCLLPVKAAVALRCDCGAVAFAPGDGGWTVPPTGGYDVVEPHGQGSIRPERSAAPAPPAPPTPSAPPAAKAPFAPRPERPWWKFWG